MEVKITTQHSVQAKTDCIHCGLCLPVCPTYQELGNEADSPRGRIYMMQSVKAGELNISEAYVHHIYQCLGCRTCESACPSGVEFSAMLDIARADIEKTYPRPAWQKFLQKSILGFVFARPVRLHAVFGLLRLYQMTGLQWLVRQSRLLKLLPLGLEDKERMLPPVPPASSRIKRGATFSAKGERRYRVALLSGCVMNELFGDIHQATIEVLTRNGCEVVVPKGQVCCGALQNHAGERAMAQALARTNLEAFEASRCDYYVNNSAGCGALVKEYDRLLAEDKAYADRALKFSRRVRDISEFLAEIGPLQPMRPLRVRVAYDDPCHLIHGQKISRAPRALLEQIPGLEMMRLPGAEECCGSAGIYNLTHREMALRLLSRKVENIKATRADWVATGNPGCLLHIAYGLKAAELPVQVIHPIQLLAQAYQGGAFGKKT